MKELHGTKYGAWGDTELPTRSPPSQHIDVLTDLEALQISLFSFHRPVSSPPSLSTGQRLRLEIPTL